MAQSPAKTLAAWQFFQQMITDVTKIVTEDERDFGFDARLQGGRRPWIVVPQRHDGVH